MEYWERATQELSRRDAVLAPVIEKFAGDRLRGSGDAFRTLANAIVGQQISVAAAAGIWRRFLERYPGPTAEAVAAADAEELRSCGLSIRKVEYLLGIARATLDGTLDDRKLSAASDDEVRATLCALRGVGPWTAEMYLIFHLRRPDVLPLGDIGLHRAARRIYRWPEGEDAARTRQRLLELGETWKPWRTVAVWYLWRELDVEPVVY